MTVLHLIFFLSDRGGLSRAVSGHSRSNNRSLLKNINFLVPWSLSPKSMLDTIPCDQNSVWSLFMYIHAGAELQKIFALSFVTCVFYFFSIIQKNICAMCTTKFNTVHNVACI